MESVEAKSQKPWMLGMGEVDTTRRAGGEAVLSTLFTQLEGFLDKLKLGHLAFISLTVT